MIKKSRWHWIILMGSLLSFTPLQAQYSAIGLGVGTSNYLGDLVPPRTYFLGTNLALGLHYEYHLAPRWSVRGSVVWGQLSGKDVNSSYDSGRRQRNLNFTSPLLEFSVMGQFFVLPFEPTYHNKRPISPYVFVGVGLFHFNPYTSYRGQQVYLQPLGTEGQGMEGYPDRYALWDWSIPFGGGVQVSLSNRLNFAFELGARKTFTDYIDDVSGEYVNLNELSAGNGILAAQLSNRTYDSDGQQIEREGVPRGKPAKDWYLITQVRLSYTLQQRYHFQPKRKKSKRGPKPKKTQLNKWM